MAPVWLRGALLAALCFAIASATSDVDEHCGEETHAEQHEVTSKWAVFFALLSLGITFSGGYMIVDWAKITILPEAGFAVLVGIVMSGIFFAAQGKEGTHIDDIIKFDKEFFFLWLLPPIIFEAGYNMKRRAFFENIVPTILYAFLGTFVSTFIVGGLVYGAGQAGMCHKLRLLPSLVFGALISATDPVTVLAVFQSLGVDINLFSMVFGESVLNDAVALVLYRTLMGFKCEEFSASSVGVAIVLFLEIFVLSFLIGVGLGALSAVVFKFLDFRHHDNHRFLEAALTVVFPWGAYFLAEALELSGIVAILFAGITMAHYTRENLSVAAKQLTSELYKVIATVAETFVFIYLGMSIFAFQKTTHESTNLVFLHNMKIRLVVVALVACLVARLFNILPCTFMVNLFRGKPNTLPKISKPFVFLMWWSGLRGGVAFAIAVANYADNEFPENDESLAILQTTLYVAVFTIFVFGGLITKLAIYFEVLESPEKRAIDYADDATLTRRPSRFVRFDTRAKALLTFQSNKPAPHQPLVEDGGEVEMQKM